MPKRTPISPTEPGQPPPPPLGSLPNRSPWALFIVLAAVFVTLSLLRGGSQAAKGPTVDYSSFYDYVEKEKVSTVSIRGQDIEGEFKTEEDIQGKKTKIFQTTAPRQD